MTIPEQRNELFEALPPDKKLLYEGEKTGNALWAIFNEYHLPEELYYEYAMAFGDVVLDLMPEAQLPQALAAMGLSQKMAGLVAHDLLELIHTGAPVAEVPQQAKPPAAQPPTPVAPQTAEPTDAAAHWAAILAKKDREQRAAAQTPRVDEQVPQPTQPAPPPQWRTTTPPPTEPGAPEQKPATDLPRYVKDDPYREPLK